MDRWKEKSKFTKNISLLVQYIFSKGYQCTLNSLADKKLAIDINLFSPEGKYLEGVDEYETFGLYWETLDEYNRWGGRFNRGEENYFEMLEAPDERTKSI